MATSTAFGFIQFPLNLMETSAVFQANQPGGKSLLQLAHEYDLGVLVNRPLNAIVGDRLLRLAEINLGEEENAEPQTLAETLSALRDSEDHLRIQVLPGLDWEPERQRQLG